jgi:hypothetical protein
MGGECLPARMILRDALVTLRPGAEGVVDRREGHPQRDVERQCRDLRVVEAGVAQRLDLGSPGGVRVAGQGPRPVGQRLVGRLQGGVVPAEHGGGDLGAHLSRQTLSQGERAVRVTEGVFHVERGTDGQPDQAVRAPAIGGTVEP